MLQLQRINFNNVAFKGSFSEQIENKEPNQLHFEEKNLVNSLNGLSALGQSCICKYCNTLVSFQDLNIKNSLACNKDGELFTGQAQTSTKNGKYAILTYENGILKKSFEKFANTNAEEQITKEFKYDENGNLTGNTLQKTTRVFVKNSDKNKKCHSTTIVDSNTSKTTNGNYSEKTITRLNGKGEIQSIKTIRSQFASLMDGTTVNAKIINENENTIMLTTFKTPEGIEGEMDFSNMKIKKLSFPEKNGEKIEFLISDNEPKTVIKKIFSENGIKTEKWTGGETPETVSIFKDNGIHKSFFNSKNERRLVYCNGEIHQIVLESDFVKNHERFSSPYNLISNIENELLCKLENEKMAPLFI